MRSEYRVLRTSILYQRSKDQPGHRNEIDRCKGDEDHICQIEGVVREIEHRGKSNGISGTGENRGTEKEKECTDRVHRLFPVPHESTKGDYSGPAKGRHKDVGGR